MKTAIILHGMPEREEYLDPTIEAPSNSHWLPWIQRKLILNGVLAQTPEMPEPYEPKYEAWRDVFERFDITEETVLVGHSCGAGFLIRWLSENKKHVGKVVLVAPWLDPEKELQTGFFDFNIDPDLVSRTQGITVMYSTDDWDVVLKTVEALKETLPRVTFQEFSGKKHFCLGDMHTREFPELLDVLLATGNGHGA